MVRGSRIEVLAEMLIENDGLSRQPIEVRRFDPVVAAATDEARMKVIETDDDGARWDFGCGIWGVGLQRESPRLSASGRAANLLSLDIVPSPPTSLERAQSDLICQRLRPT
jgi:hypothetical protein